MFQQIRNKRGLPQPNSITLIRPNVFHLRLVTKQGCPLFPLLSNIVFDVLGSVTKEENEIKAYCSSFM
jgi:hypothetical protein